MDPASPWQQLLTPYSQHQFARTTTERHVRVVITFRDDAANDANGAEHAEDGEILGGLVGELVV